MHRPLMIIKCGHNDNPIIINPLVVTSEALEFSIRGKKLGVLLESSDECFSDERVMKRLKDFPCANVY